MTQDLFACELSPVRQAGDISEFLQVMRPVIDRIVESLGRATFDEDPICGPRYSRMNSILSSAQKRHGRVLEIALREGLHGSNRHRVWTEPKFAISRAADLLMGSQSEDACGLSELPYGEALRTIQIDVCTFDETDQGIRSYELKRANGLHDAGKIRSMRRDLACTQLLLKSYGHSIGLRPAHADAKVIFYYGRRSIPIPFSLIGTRSMPAIHHIDSAFAADAFEIVVKRRRSPWHTNKKIAPADCSLFLWTSWPQLEDALNVIAAWGFIYKTCAFCWTKAHAGQLEMFEQSIPDQMGLGYWTRANSEACLLATKGRPTRLNMDVRQAIIEPRREHSRKPSLVYQRIERLVAGPYLELFARARRIGWDSWGNELGKFGEAAE